MIKLIISVLENNSNIDLIHNQNLHIAVYDVRCDC